MSIRLLPDDVVQKIKSSVVIVSLNGVVCGLLANALDAGSTKVNISVDWTRGNCTAEDNGLGIPQQDFEPDGGLGKLHHTSRFPSRSAVHGKHGDFIAALSTLSLLSITSHHRGHASHNTLSIHHSKVLARHIPSPPEQSLVSFDHGTRVKVQDLFGSMPVRVKKRAIASEKYTLEKEWTRLVRDVAALLLAWPIRVNVFLRDVVTQRELRFRSSGENDLTSRTSRLLTQATLADSSDADSWVPISASSGSVSVKGCICQTPSATRRSQFISLGIQPIANDYGTNVFYEEINKVFNNSSFGIVEETDYRSRSSSPKVDDFTGKELRSRRAIERWPMFYIQINLSECTDTFAVGDLLNERGPTISKIVDLLRAICYGFLKKHQFRPRKVRLVPRESFFSTSGISSPTPTQSERTIASGSSSSKGGTPSPDTESPFDVWHRVKVGLATPRNSTPNSFELPSRQTSRPIEPLIGSDGKLLRKPFDEPLPELDNESAPAGPVESGTPLGGNQSDTFLGKYKKPETVLKPEQSQWLKNVIQSWQNPVFENVQSLIPRVNEDTQYGPHHRCCEAGVDAVAFDSASMSLKGRVSRQGLLKATVISQVDKKFILVKLPLDSVSNGEDSRQSSALVMLDQHAVDERCRLEDLMASYFVRDGAGNLKPNTETLERPITFEVSSKEIQLLDEHRPRFAAWGIVFHVQPTGTKVTVTALPPSILERCRFEPRLLMDLLAKEVWRIVEDGATLHPQPPNSQSHNDSTSKQWVTSFTGCPRGILELLYSRACRSAIMFNDFLSNDACETLIQKLATCAFPFQCAHGRPSMVPLVDLGKGGRFGKWEDARREWSFGKWARET